MFISNYPWNLMLGNVEFKILRKLLRDEDLTPEENARADQMSETLDVMYQKKMDEQTYGRPHRIPGDQTRRNVNHVGVPRARVLHPVVENVLDG